MWPHFLIRFGDLEVQPYGLILMAVYVTAVAFSFWEVRKHSGVILKLIDVCFWMILGGLAGARALYVLFNWHEFQHAPLEIFALWKGGMVYYGGMIGGSLASLWAARVHKISFLYYGDIIYPYVVLSSGLGRMGCLLRGCCYGKPSEMPWAITFADPLSAARPLNTALHPTQIYLIAAGVIIFLILMFMRTRKRFDGEIVSLSFILYGLVRFIIDFWRGDVPAYPVFGWYLTGSQIVSILVLTLGIVLFTILALKSRLASVNKGETNEKIFER